jgi:hypothetical protein
LNGSAPNAAIESNLLFDGTTNRLLVRGNVDLQSGTSTLGVLQPVGWHESVVWSANIRYTGSTAIETPSNWEYIRAAGANNAAGITAYLRGNGTETSTYFIVATAPTSTGANTALTSLTERMRIGGNGILQLPVTGIYQGGSGSLTTPAISYTGDPNTGIYFPAADTIGFVEGGIEAMRIDSSGRVGIGTTSPQTLLHVGSGTAPTAVGQLTVASTNSSQMTVTDGTRQALLGADIGSNAYVGSYSNHEFGLRTNNTERWKLTTGGILESSGAQTIRTSTGNLTIGAGGTNSIIFQTNAANKMSIDNGGNVVALGNMTAFGTPSDIRFKYNIQPLVGALDVITQLEGVRFNWNVDTPSYTFTGLDEDIGFIAQQVQHVLPNLVREGLDGYLGLRERAIVPLLVEAIKELSAKVDRLQKQLDER